MHSSSGQALVEYILMVIVVLILIVGFTMAFFQPLNTFLAKLNNTYIRCLLETGELPRVGVESGAGAGICDAEMPKFEGKNFDGSASNADGSKSENQKGESSSSDGSAGTSAGSSSGSSSGSASGSLAGRKSSLIRNGMRSNGTARGELGSKDKTTNIPIDSFNEGNGFTSGSGGGALRRSNKKTRQVALSSLTEYERKKAEREEMKKRTVAMDSESFAQTPKKKVLVKPPPPKENLDDLNVDTDYGNVFKIFFMIIIILFIVILMGSQALQLTNNSD